MFSSRNFVSGADGSGILEEFNSHLQIQFVWIIIVSLGLTADWITKTGNMEVNLFILEGLAQ